MDNALKIGYFGSVIFEEVFRQLPFESFVIFFDASSFFKTFRKVEMFG